MVVSIPAALLLLVLVVVLLRGGYVRAGSAGVCALFGFFLASTGIAPAVTAITGTVTGWLSTL